MIILENYSHLLFNLKNIETSRKTHSCSKSEVTGRNTDIKKNKDHAKHKHNLSATLRNGYRSCWTVLQPS